MRDAPPTVRQEVNRKTWDALGSLLEQLQAGAITDAQFKIATDALWTTVSGLVDKDLMETFSQIQDSRRGTADWTVKRLFGKGDTVVALTWPVGSKSVALRCITRTGNNCRVLDSINAKKAQEQFNRLAMVTIARGYTELDIPFQGASA
jgi:hypothetical protein